MAGIDFREDRERMRVATILAAALCAGLIPGSVWARFEVGGGMEYYTVQTYARDLQGNNLQTLLQTTLAGARLSFQEGPLTVKAAAGITDWNIGGQWRGTDVDLTPFELYYTWSWQNVLRLEADYEFYHGWSAGLCGSDHQLRHYSGNTQITFLQYRFRELGFCLNYTPVETQDVRIFLTAAYSPWASVETYQDSFFFHDRALAVDLPWDSSGAGVCWRGRVQMQYRDSAGWGVDLLYEAGFARFSQPRNLDDFSLRFGSLTGYFSLWF